MITKNDKGREVYYLDEGNAIYPGIVKETYTDTVKQELHAVVYGTGIHNFGDNYMRARNCFLTEDEALKEQKKRRDDKISSYLSRLKTPADLVRFWYTHESCKDNEAWKAYEIAAENIMGIILN